MNSDQIKGRLKELAGKMKRNTADVTDNDAKRVEGSDQELRGNIQKNWGDAKSKAADIIDK